MTPDFVIFLWQNLAHGARFHHTEIWQFWVSKPVSFYRTVSVGITINEHKIPPFCGIWESLNSKMVKIQHTEKSFQNLIKSIRNQIVIIIIWSIWNQTDVRLVPNQSENGIYNLNSGSFNKISKRFLCVFKHHFHTFPVPARFPSHKSDWEKV